MSTNPDEPRPLLDLRIPSREAEILPAAERALDAIRAAGYCGRGEPRLKLALIELITNAVEHGNRFDPQKSVTLSIRAAGPRLEVSVADDGPGFDAARLAPSLGDVALEAKRGRGLAIVKEILGAPPRLSRRGNEVTIAFERARFA